MFSDDFQSSLGIQQCQEFTEVTKSFVRTSMGKVFGFCGHLLTGKNIDVIQTIICTGFEWF